jgi:hypothetical protein
MKKLILILMLTSCSTLRSSVPFEDRVYDINPDLTAFIWGHVVCVRKFLGICTKKELKIESIPVEFKNKEQARQLFDKEFVLRQRKRPL